MNKFVVLAPFAVTALSVGFAVGYLRVGDSISIQDADREVSVKHSWGNETYRAEPSKACELPRQRADVATESFDPSKPIPEEGRTIRDDQGIEVISKVYEIDQKYRSMRGPWSRNVVQFLDTEPPELIWVTGAKVDMVGEDGKTTMPEQFMCHANFDIEASAHGELHGMNKPIDERLFTLSQGQLNVQFPPGCGFPMMSNESINLITQVLNLNLDNPENLKVRHKVRINFVRQSDLKKPMKPLYEAGCSSMKSLEDRSLVYDYAPEGAPTASGLLTSMCSPGKTANAHDNYPDRLGRKFTGHWIVKPGREENRTRVTTLMRLQWDTRVHHIAVHMHPFAESLELRDITEDKTVFKSHVKNLDGQVGLEKVEYFSSEEGLPVFKDHEYELISVYNNTSEEDHDSMAVMYLYMHDQEFQVPETKLLPPRG